jgi:hypothetical protein
VTAYPSPLPNLSPCAGCTHGNNALKAGDAIRAMKETP